jgi:hypothetical protein
MNFLLTSLPRPNQPDTNVPTVVQLDLPASFTRRQDRRSAAMANRVANPLISAGKLGTEVAGRCLRQSVV